MARPRKRVKRNSNVRNCQYSPPAGTTRKRNIYGKISDVEVRNLMGSSVYAQTYNQRKRRRTSRYNLRRSSSVILVSETPCCQTPEQQEKFTKLGLNSALFLKGSQCPKRKQSHISIITISSDDEETSEERTSEWVNSLGQNYQSNAEPQHSSACENPEKREQTFQPLCSSTPISSQCTKQCQPAEWNKAEEFDICTLDSTGASTRDSQDKLKGAKELGNFGSTPTEDPRRPSPLDDQVRQEQTFQLVISIPDSLTDLQCVMQYQPDELNKAEMCCCSSSAKCYIRDQDEICNQTNGTAYKSSYQGFGSSFTTGFGSNSSSLFFKPPTNSGSGNLQNEKTIEGLPANVPCFYFGSSTDSRNVTSTPVSPFKSYFNNRMDTSTSGGFKCGSTSNEGQCETDRFDMPDTNSMKNTNHQTESNSLNSDDPDVLLEKKSHSKNS